MRAYTSAQSLSVRRSWTGGSILPRVNGPPLPQAVAYDLLTLITSSSTRVLYRYK